MEKTPQHIGIIIDGNRRWARKRGKPTFFGHKKGYESVKKIAKYAFNNDVKFLSIYAFSTENWKRDKEEVSYLMDLIKLVITKDLRELNNEGIKIIISGDRSAFSKELQEVMSKAIDLTKNNKKGVLNLCLNYGGRAEILNAIKNIMKDKVGVDKVDEKLFTKYLYTKDVPDPELIIRTSGEQRLSGFLTWQSVYSEFYFPKKDWPAFTEKDLDKAIEEFQKRGRRFGGN